MATDCPTHSDLLLEVLGLEHEPAAARVGAHLAVCETCRGTVEKLRESASALRAAPPPASPQRAACLDEVELAAVLEGGQPAAEREARGEAEWEARGEADRRAVEHLAACTSCRARLADVSRLLRDPSLAREVERLESVPPAGGRRSRRLPAALAGGLAAAALAGFLLWPRLATDPAMPGMGADEAYRERTITTTAAPRIVGPLGEAGDADSLRWTSVPRADLYRITIWNSDGSTAWQGQTRDTVLALPGDLTGGGARTVLWDVKARTGWERWVASELVELTITEPERPRP